jgi:transcription antitermination factor NusG
MFSTLTYMIFSSSSPLNCYFSERSSVSRCKFIEIGDISDDDALKYLEQCQIPKACMEIVKDHVRKWIGGRFKDLSTVVEEINDLREESENEEEVVQKIPALLQGTFFVVNISKRRD